MMHLLMGVDPGPLGRYPFNPVFSAPQIRLARTLGFQVHPDTELETLPLVSGFLGCDILAAAVATRLDEAAQGTLLVDLGTNGELLLKAENAIYATSCATGPAFEGGNIRYGMQALPGAIDRVVYHPDQDAVALSIIQGRGDLFQPAVGICGAGFISAIATLVRNGIIKPDGAFNPECRSRHLIDVNRPGRCFRLTAEQAEGNRHHVAIYQSDVRALQLAKGAVAAGIHMLCQQAGIERPHNIILAGAMGNFMDIDDARTIGLFPDQVPVQVMGNAAGAGAILAAMAPASRVHFQDLARAVTTISLSTDTRFQAIFVKKMAFPASIKNESKMRH